MNFTDIVGLVLDKVKRPDKKVAIQAAVNASILYYSTEYDYKEDLAEQPLLLSPAGYELDYDLAELPLFRKVDYLKYAGTRKYIQELETRTLTAECSILDKYYIAGSSLKIKLAQEATALDLSYFRYPPALTDAAPDYWMLRGNWEAIMERAASKVFNDIGDPRSSQTALQQATLASANFRGDYVRSNQHT